MSGWEGKRGVAGGRWVVWKEIGCFFWGVAGRDFGRRRRACAWRWGGQKKGGENFWGTRMMEGAGLRGKGLGVDDGGLSGCIQSEFDYGGEPHHGSMILRRWFDGKWTGLTHGSS